MKYNFYKENDKWYVDLPDIGFEKDDLEMVVGSDNLLDIISNYTNNLTLEVSLIDDNNCKYVLCKLKEEDDGCYYTVYKDDEEYMFIWLCDVLYYIYNTYPNIIYIK